MSSKGKNLYAGQGVGLRAYASLKFRVVQLRVARGCLHWREIVLTLSFTSPSHSAASFLVPAVTLGNLGVLL